MRKSIWLLGILWLWAGLGLAQDFPPRPSPPRLVNDLANILSPEEEQALEQKLVNYNDSTSTQIAVVNITSIGGYDVSDYAFKLAEQWGIGQQGKNNGILILTAVNERKIYIATGYGLEGAVPDAIAKRITEYTIKPEYKQGNYYAGLDKGTSFIIDVASGEYKADPRQQQGDDGGGIPILWIIIGILIIIFLISRRGGGRGGRGGGMRTLGGPFFPPVIFGDFSGGRGIFGGGGGGFGGGGGGGFGGFGGGSFGGGGAGSDW
ncbi:TPM domain-containing protein [Rufibacter hautae]|uniref:TPM domain-containing protein n=1 Tax=Rufibacter hautae TaxID=2595005 RepID=A0A5B6TM97_9BACT|nr:TPM domain-containing protein [Rufibacter hautae]KAA3440525.1 TPM domain-containing protein [Rufibacter hautae]